jgi:hypothetical protein
MEVKSKLNSIQRAEKTKQLKEVQERMSIQQQLLQDLLNSSLRQEELAGLTPDMIREMSFRSERKPKDSYEFEY